MTGAYDADAGPDAVMLAAIDWSILIAEAPQDAELRTRLEAWLSADAAHRQVWAEVTRFDGLLAETAAERPMLPLLVHPHGTRRPSPRLRRGGRRIAALCVAASVAAAAFIGGPVVMLHARADHLTGTAEQQLVRLEDGSTVRLGPKSAIRLADGAGQRQVELLAGEAYFEVARDTARPFRVTAGNATVTVLGTGFDVRRAGGALDVAVRHGRVRVASPAKAVELADGDQARLDPGGAIALRHVAPGIVGGWSARRMLAVDRPLAEVVADLRRYHQGAIVLTSAALGRRSVTGMFDTADPVAAARLMVQPHGGKVRSISPWLIVISED